MHHPTLKENFTQAIKAANDLEDPSEYEQEYLCDQREYKEHIQIIEKVKGKFEKLLNTSKGSKFDLSSVSLPKKLKGSVATEKEQEKLNESLTVLIEIKKQLDVKKINKYFFFLIKLTSFISSAPPHEASGSPQH